MTARFMPHATVALIIEYKDRYLMVEEVNDDQNDRPVFGMPSGHIEAKESVIEAALREGREETGAEVVLDSLIGVYDYVKDYETIERFCFKAHLKEPREELRAADPDHEINAVRWYSKDEIYARKEDWRTRLVGVCMDDYLAGKSYPLDLIRVISTVTDI